MAGEVERKAGEVELKRFETPDEVRVFDQDVDKDLGFGSRVLARTSTRFLNRDGSFNVVREGLSFWRSLSLYHWLLNLSWPAFFAVVVGGYFATNLAFAAGYMLCGRDALQGLSDVQNPESRLLESFFFSVHTLATIGYGTLSPRTLPAHLLVTVEALFGLLGFALATGLLFSRFSRPTACIAFSRNAVVAPYQKQTGLMFRIANQRSNQLIEVQVTLTLSRQELVEGKLVRRFHELNLERKRVVFFPLHWVVVHPIDERSPLHGVSEQEFRRSDAELIVLITGTDETFFQTVHARSSYRFDEVVWGVRFADLFIETADGRPGIDLRRLHDLERV